MTKPTNILLEPSLRAAAKRRADERGLSLSAYIRDLIRADDALARETASDITPLVGILGSGAGPTDIANDKREMVEQAFGELFEAKLSQRTAER